MLSVDYALRANGGSIIPSLTSETQGYREVNLGVWDRVLFLVRGYYVQHATITPPHAIVEDVVRVGQCWAFSGSHGHVGISLAEPIIITHITFHHPDHRELSPETLAQAPSVIYLWSLLPHEESHSLDPRRYPVVSGENFVTRKGHRSPGSFLRLANVTYQPLSGNQYTVLVTPTGIISSSVVLEVTDNAGGNRTCLYRISVHGIPPKVV
ncbi:hypothetical protein PQX77_011712 [Marasmius sp. AFHP31]|nr:hypothetical protein PQX77_011712 [Marasmius sp. AFHP31]